MVEVLMPGVGAGTTHGRVIQWLKKVGDQVAVGDVLAEIETDKAVIELEAFDEGVLTRILADAGGDEVEVGAKLAEISPAAAGATAQSATREASAPVQARHTQNEKLDTRHSKPASVEQSHSAPATSLDQADLDRVFASPSARRLARELDVPLAQLTGSGPRGRIVRVDVERAHEQLPERAPQVADCPARGTAPVEPAVQGTMVPHSPMRKTIARRLQESKQTVPHFYLVIDVEMHKMLKLRERLKKTSQAEGDTLQLSLNDLVTYAVGKTLADFPAMNVRWTPDAVEQLQQVDLSVAVATDKGLITPIVRDVGSKTLGRVAHELRGLVERARAGRLAPAEYEGGSMSVSNLGMLGIREFSAIINPPQASILAIGAVSARPVAKKNKVKVRPVMTVTLSADHRVIDGELGARFLARLKQSMENPMGLLV